LNAKPLQVEAHSAAQEGIPQLGTAFPNWSELVWALGMTSVTTVVHTYIQEKRGKYLHGTLRAHIYWEAACSLWQRTYGQKIEMGGRGPPYSEYHHCLSGAESWLLLGKLTQMKGVQPILACPCRSPFS
jgi:hypothetical protein